MLAGLGRVKGWDMGTTAVSLRGDDHGGHPGTVPQRRVSGAIVLAEVGGLGSRRAEDEPCRCADLEGVGVLGSRKEVWGTCIGMR